MRRREQSGGLISLALLTALSLALLGACAPVEQKPQLTAPQSAEEKLALSEAIIAEEAQAKQVIAAELDAELEAEIATDELAKNKVSDETTIDAPIETPIETPVQTELDVSGEELAEEASREDETAKEKVEETPPPPPPFDPVILVGERLDAIETLFGSADLAFDNGGLRVSHYRGEACLMLVFSSIKEATIITHIDLRAPILGTAYDPMACHDELGRKKR